MVEILKNHKFFLIISDAYFLRFRRDWKIPCMSEYGYHKKPVRVSPLDKLLHMQTVCPASGFLDTHNSIMSKYFFPPF